MPTSLRPPGLMVMTCIYMNSQRYVLALRLRIRDTDTVLSGYVHRCRHGCHCLQWFKHRYMD